MGSKCMVSGTITSWKHRIDESKSLISISFMEVKEIQNREILQAYMKYELGITGQAVSTIVRRFVCIRNFIELLEQEKILAIHATVAEVKSMQTACENGEYRQRDLMKEFSVSVIL